MKDFIRELVFSKFSPTPVTVLGGSEYNTILDTPYVLTQEVSKTILYIRFDFLDVLIDKTLRVFNYNIRFN